MSRRRRGRWSITVACAALAVALSAPVAVAAPTATPGAPVLGWGWAAADGFCRSGAQIVSTPTPVASLTDLLQVSRQGYTTYALVSPPQSGSEVVACGDGTHGALGDSPDVTSSHAPVPVGALRQVKQVVSVGGFRATGVALLRDGTVRTWGEAALLGTGATDDAFEPVVVPGLVGIVALAAGGGHVLALRDDGTVLAWGGDTSGQVGVPTPTSGIQPTPVTVPGLSGVRGIAAGGATSFAILADGSVVSWGASPALGDGSTTNRSTPAPVPGLRRITQVAAYNQHAVARRADGAVFTWGVGGNYGGLGVRTHEEPTPIRLDVPEPVVSVATSPSDGYGVLADGRLLAWGSTHHGMLGNGETRGWSGPALVAGITGVTAVFTGDLQAYAVLGGA